MKKIFFHLKKNCGKLWLNAFSRLKIRKRWKMEDGGWRLEVGRWVLHFDSAQCDRCWVLGVGGCTSTPLSMTGAGWWVLHFDSAQCDRCWVLGVGGWVLDVG
ncbi:MAG: hypothetical protein CMC13_01865 [Flavobacteriaceae bacterium]|nr:hypothetical protein [Flavobacteriaceae bacterium]